MNFPITLLKECCVHRPNFHIDMMTSVHLTVQTRMEKQHRCLKTTLECIHLTKSIIHVTSKISYGHFVLCTKKHYKVV